MIKFNICELSISSVVQRFYLMMGLAIALGFMGYLSAAAIVAALLAVSCILGISVSFTRVAEQKQKRKEEGKVITLENYEGRQKVS